LKTQNYWFGSKLLHQRWQQDGNGMQSWLENVQEAYSWFNRVFKLGFHGGKDIFLLKQCSVMAQY